MKFFLDTADLAEIEEAASWGALAGVTTNPSLYHRGIPRRSRYQPQLPVLSRPGNHGQGVPAEHLGSRKVPG